MKPVLTTLKNGLKVCLIDTNSFPSLTTILLVGAGSRYENTKNNGIAHFFEHMAFKGSKNFPDSFTISSTIEGLGGVFNAFTSKDHTGYWIKATNDHFETVLAVLSDMIMNSFLLEDEINREKGVIVEEINMYEDTPRWKSGDLFEELMYKGSSLGMDIAGTRDTVTNFNRKTFTDYMDELYHPNNAVLVVAGGFGKDKADYIKKIEERFGGWESKKVKGTYGVFKKIQTSPQILIHSKKTEQTHFCLGFHSYNIDDKRKYPLALLSTILGGGMSSRLFMQVRERRGLCYYIATGRTSYKDVGNFVTSAGVTNNLEKTKEAIRVTLEEHKKTTMGDITDVEIKRAKDLIKGRTILSMEDSQNVSLYFGLEMLLQNKSTTPEEMIETVQKVTKDEILSVAKDVFNRNNINLSLIGPFKEGDITAEDLQI